MRCGNDRASHNGVRQSQRGRDGHETIFNDQNASMYLCDVKKKPKMKNLRIDFIGKELDIVCWSKKLKNLNCTKMTQLHRELYFNFNLFEWKLNGPAEIVPEDIKKFTFSN